MSALGTRAGQAKSYARLSPREYVVGLLTRPRETLTLARGQRFWGTATVVAFVAQYLDAPSDAAFDAVILPLLIIVGLMASCPLIAVVGAVCGGVRGVADATASQFVLIVAALSLPGSVASSAGAPVVAAVVALGALVVAAIVTVLLFTRAFEASPGRAAVGLLVLIGAASALVVLVVLALHGLHAYASRGGAPN